MVDDAQDNKPIGRDRWVGKVNFVEIRSFWHVFRSFDRMWSFFILCLQVFNFLNVFSYFFCISNFVTLVLKCGSFLQGYDYYCLE